MEERVGGGGEERKGGRMGRERKRLWVGLISDGYPFLIIQAEEQGQGADGL